MILKDNFRYRHRRMIDVDMVILSPHRKGDKYVLVIWVNRHTGGYLGHEPFPVDRLKSEDWTRVR